MLVCTECILNKREVVTMKGFVRGFAKYVVKDFWKEVKEDWETLKKELSRKQPA